MRTRMLVAGALTALALGALAPVAQAHTLGLAKAKSQARADSRAYIADPRSDAVSYILQGCFRRSAHAFDCRVTFVMEEGHDNVNDSALVDADGLYWCDENRRIRYRNSRSRELVSYSVSAMRCSAY